MREKHQQKMLTSFNTMPTFRPYKRRTIYLLLLAVVLIPCGFWYLTSDWTLMQIKRMNTEKKLQVTLDGLVENFNEFKQKRNNIGCSNKNFNWENQLFIGCNQETYSAATPEEFLVKFCDSLNKFKMSWTKADISKVSLKSQEQQHTDTITVLIDTFDEEHNRQSYGYDLIVIRAAQINGDGRSSGVVINFWNGSYLGVLNVYWTGVTAIHAKIVSRIQNTCLRQNAMKKYGSAKYSMPQIRLIYGQFQKKALVETTECTPNMFIFGRNKLCNFTSLNDGMSWFCGHPDNKDLECSDIQSFGEEDSKYKGVAKNTKVINPFEANLQQVNTLKYHRVSDLHRQNQCNASNSSETWTGQMPTGFWLNGSWNVLHCYSPLKHTIDEYRVCLKNYTMIFIGDSTIRQYANYFRTNIFELPEIGHAATFKKYPYHKYITGHKYGIKMLYFNHEMPFHYGKQKLPSNGIVSTAGFLDSLKHNKGMVKRNVILLVGYYTHLSSFPPDIFRDRVKTFARAVERFLEENPLTKVFFKSPHLTISNRRWFDPRNARLFRLILEEEFARILHQVVYLDTWDIAVAHNSIVLHPGGNAFKSQIQQFMSYIC